jgi:HK97 family phage major capsid protein
VPFSFEVQGDAVDFMSELAMLLMDGAEQLNATAYTTGSGSGQPTGVITKLVASAGTVALIAPGTGETLASGDVYSVQNALPPRFQPNAPWCANLSIMNSLRQFETTNEALKFPGLETNPPILLGRTLYENSNMDGTINAAATENKYPAPVRRLQGRHGHRRPNRQHARAGSSPGPRQPATNRSTRRPAVVPKRSDVVVPQAFRPLSIPTTA